MDYEVLDRIFEKSEISCDIRRPKDSNYDVSVVDVDRG